MALTKIGTDGVKDDAVNQQKIADSAITTALIADGAVGHNDLASASVYGAKIASDAITTDKIADQAVTLAKLPHGDGSSDGKFLRANNGADPSFETIDLTALSASNLTSGTIPDARLPATLPAISGANLTNLPAGGQVHNLVTNGNFKLAQRGTSHGSSGYRTVDRWKMSAGGASAALTQSQYSAISGTSPYAEGHHQAFRIENAGQNANTQGYVYMQHHIEAQDIVNSGWNYKSSSSYITLSFWVRASVTQTYLVNLNTNDGTMREWNHLVSLTADNWTKVTMTIPGDSNITMNDDNGIGLSLYFNAYIGSHYTSGSTVDQWVTHAGYTSRPDMGAGWWTTSNSTFMLTGVQLEAGNTASDFAHESHADTLLKCQRYYYVHCSDAYENIGIGFQYYSGNIFISHGFPTTMRVEPTMEALSGSSGAYVYEKLFSNTASYTNTITHDTSKTGHNQSVVIMGGDASRAGQAVRCSVHWFGSDLHKFLAYDAEL
ncbi:MAG: hypothetical protein CBC57_07135 [Euryarchaeota archaeon TMED97]|nr:MAG: hypothetical protein CBC57_07135 [Euryarchaeota archaeon TMED97]|tara:strand:- start:477 stop:1949 length:1473 start_codon:yes stop_codon:yes gene_type:complete